MMALSRITAGSSQLAHPKEATADQNAALIGKENTNHEATEHVGKRLHDDSPRFRGMPPQVDRQIGGFSYSRAVVPSMDFSRTRKGAVARLGASKNFDESSEVESTSQNPDARQGIGSCASKLPSWPSKESGETDPQNPSDSRSVNPLVLHRHVHEGPPRVMMRQHKHVCDGEQQLETVSTNLDADQAKDTQYTTDKTIINSDVPCLYCESPEKTGNKDVTSGGHNNTLQCREISPGCNRKESGNQNDDTEMTYDLSSEGHGHTQEQVSSETTHGRILNHNGKHWPSSSLEYVLNNLTSSWRRYEERLAIEHSEELEVWKSELLQALTKNEALQNCVERFTKQNQNLTSVVAEQKSKLDASSARLAMFRKFMEGLGSDLTALRKDANHQRQRQDQVSRDVQCQRAVQATLREEIGACVAKSVDMEQNALENCREITRLFEGSQERTSSLEKQLLEKDRQLAEERQIRTQLTTLVTSVETSRQTIVNQLSLNHSSLLEILGGAEANTGTADETNNVRSLLERILVVSTSLQSQETFDDKHSAALKDLLNGCLTNLTAQISKAAEAQSQEMLNASQFLLRWADSFPPIHTQLQEQINTVRDSIAQQDITADLRASLDKSEMLLADLRIQLSTSQSKQHEIEGFNVALQSEISALQQQAVCREVRSEELNDTRRDLELKQRCLEGAEFDLSKNVQELETLKAINKILQKQVDDMKDQLNGITKFIQDFQIQPERMIQAQHQKFIQSYDTAEQARTSVEQHEDSFTNTSETAARGQAETNSHLQASKDVLNVAEPRMPNLAEVVTDRQRQGHPEAHQHLLQSRNAADEVKTVDIPARYSDITPVDDNVALNSFNAATIPLAELEAKAAKTEAQKSALLRQLEHVQAAIMDAQSERDRAVATLEQHRNKRNAEIVKLTGRIATLEDLANQQSAASDKASADYLAAQVKEKHKFSRQLEALQVSLAEARSQSHRQQLEDASFRAEVEQSWQMEQIKHDKKINELSDALSSIKKQALESDNEKIRLRHELEVISKSTMKRPSMPNTSSRTGNVVDVGPNNRSDSLFLGHHASEDRKHAEDAAESSISQTLLRLQSSSLAGTASSEYPATLVKDSQANSEHSIGSLLDEVADYISKEVDMSPTGVLRFNDHSRQSLSSVIATSGSSDVCLRPLAPSAVMRNKTTPSQAHGTTPRPNSKSKRVRARLWTPQGVSQESMLQEHGSTHISPIEQAQQDTKHPEISTAQQNTAATSSTSSFIPTNTEHSNLITYTKSNIPTLAKTERFADPRLKTARRPMQAKRKALDQPPGSSVVLKRGRTNAEESAARINLPDSRRETRSHAAVMNPRDALISRPNRSQQQDSAPRSRMQTRSGMLTRETKGSKRKAKREPTSLSWMTSPANIYRS